MTDLEPTKVYDLEVPPSYRATLLAPYDLAITVDGSVRIEIGRFSQALLGRVQLLANDENRCVLKIGSFCETNRDSQIIVGGEHRNASLLNYTFGSQGYIFRRFMTPQAIDLASVGDADPIEIGDNVIVSAGAMVLGGARIGDGAVIGAGAVVPGRCEPCGIYAGVPARRLRDRFPPERQAIYRAMRLADIMAHHLPALPLLLQRVERGEIALEEYLGTVSFLPARPTVHLSAARGADSSVQVTGITGYSVGGEAVRDEHAVGELRSYFAQLGTTDKLKWTPDIFHSLGLY